MRKLSVAGVVLLVVLSACKTTSTTVKNTGEPLEAKTEVFDYKGHFSSSGDWVPAGTAVIFHGFYQGADKIGDELDYYNVAGETDRVKKIVEWRTKYNTSLMATWGFNGLGAAAIATGAGIFAVAGSANPETFVTSPLGQASMGLMAGGGIVLGAAFLVGDTLFGPKESLHLEGDYELLYPLSDALDVERTYNEKLTSGGGSSEPSGT